MRISLSGVRMQFGRIHGIAMFVLGLVLVLVQAAISLSPRRETESPARDTTSTVESKMSYAPGVIGGIFLLGGIWIVYSSRRSDEPPAERAVK
jgi:uncharacterized membrane protein